MSSNRCALECRDRQYGGDRRKLGPYYLARGLDVVTTDPDRS